MSKNSLFTHGPKPPPPPERRGFYLPPWNDIYHFLLSTTWPRFIGLLAVVYFAVNFVFGVIYYAMGPGGFIGPGTQTSQNFFVECFFFSVQTFSTIGYGHISPGGLPQNILVSIQALMGLISVGMMSGLFFARFSRPTARVVFSDVALITSFLGQKSLIFRMANARMNQIVEANVTVIFMQNEVTPEGISLRVQREMKLIRERSVFFTLSWMVVHPIDEKSPLLGKKIEDLDDKNAEIVVSMLGLDKTFSQTIHARHSYKVRDFIYDKHFVDIVSRDGEKVLVDIGNISTVKDMPFVAQGTPLEYSTQKTQDAAQDKQDGKEAQVLPIKS